MATMDVEHRKLIEEENVNINDLPSEIRAKMRGYNLNLNNYAKNPSPAAEKVVVKLDVEIADMIQTWLDDKLGDAEELDSNDDNTGKFSKKAVIPDPAPEPTPAPAPTPTPAPAPEPNIPPVPPVEVYTPPAEPEMDAVEKALRAQWQNGIITIPAFRALLGREPNYPNQKVGNVTMRKTYGRDEYKQIS